MMKIKVTLIILVVCLSICTINVSAQPAGWSGDDNLLIFMEINGIPTSSTNPDNNIQIGPTDDVLLELTIHTNSNITLHSMMFTISYMGLPIIVNDFDLNDTLLLSDMEYMLMNNTIPLGESFSISGISIISGTLLGAISFNYSVYETTENAEVSQLFYLYLGETGVGTMTSIIGIITLMFTLSSIFSIVSAFGDFKKGISHAGRLSNASTAFDVGVIPGLVVLRRTKKKDNGYELIATEEIGKRMKSLADIYWNKKQCPRCGKKWKHELQICKKCKLNRDDALNYFAEGALKYSQGSMKIVKPGSKVTVQQMGEKMKLSPVKAGILASVLIDMGIFHTKSVKTPYKKISYSGFTLSSMYMSWMQMFYGVSSHWLIMIMYGSFGLIVTVLIGEFMMRRAKIRLIGMEL